MQREIQRPDEHQRQKQMQTPRSGLTAAPYGRVQHRLFRRVGRSETCPQHSANARKAAIGQRPSH